MATVLELPQRERTIERLPVETLSGVTVPPPSVTAVGHVGPSLVVKTPGPELVSLRSMKAVAESFDPSHPLRVLLMGEPDELPANEFVAKVRGWFRLMKAKSP